jgi:uncharacterized protein (TIGR03083 family)
MEGPVIGTQQRSDLQHAIEGACERLITIVANAADLDVRVPDSPIWTARQAFAHVVTVTPRYTAGARRTGRWVDAWPLLAAMNDEEIAAADSLDVTALASQLRAELAELFAEVGSFGPQAPEYAFHGGAKVAADGALRCLLGEFEMHGRDIARALGHRWTIPPAHARLILDGAAPVMPGLVNPATAAGHTATYEFRIRGGTTHFWAFRDGRFSIVNELRRPDVVVSADPVACLLVFYGRRSQWSEILRGRMLAWGRRPWLALFFVKRFYHP